MKTFALFFTELKMFIRCLPATVLAVVVFFGSFYLALPESVVEVGRGYKFNIAVVCNIEQAKTVFSLAASSVTVIEKIDFMEESAAMAALESGAADAVLVVPDNLADALINADGGQAVIDFYAKDAEVGAVGANLLQTATRVINSMQNAVYAFEEDAEGKYPDYDSFYKAETSFIMSMLSQLLLRGAAVKEVSGVSPYLSHVITLAAAVSAICLSGQSALRLSKEVGTGYTRRLKLRKISFAKLYAIKIFMLFIFSLIFSACAAIVLKHADIIISVPYLCAAFVFASLSFFCLLSPAALLLKSASKTSLFISVLFIILMFAGGGFYPVYLMEASFRTFNPVWLCRLLAEAALGGALTINASYFVICAAAVVLSAFCRGRDGA